MTTNSENQNYNASTSEQITLSPEALEAINISRSRDGRPAVEVVNGALVETGTPATTPTQDTQPTGTPSAPEKFIDPVTKQVDVEKLLKSYQALESFNSKTASELAALKASATNKPAAPAPASTEPVLVTEEGTVAHPDLDPAVEKEIKESESIGGIKVQALMDEFTQGGNKLSEATISKLKSAGLTDKVITDYSNQIASYIKMVSEKEAGGGGKAPSTDTANDKEDAAFVSKVTEAVGGQDKLNEYLKFAADNLSKEQTARYDAVINKALANKDFEVATMAIETLKTAYEAHYGTTRAPGSNLLQAEAIPSSYLGDVFANSGEYRAAINAAKTAQEVDAVMAKLNKTVALNKNYR